MMNFTKLSLSRYFFALICLLPFVLACAPQPAPTQATIQRTNVATPQSPNNPTAPPSSVPTLRSNEPTLQLYDAHMHYSADSMSRYSIAAINSILDRAGIRRVLLSSTPNDGTLKLYEAYPARFVPEFRPYRAGGETGNWFTDPTVVLFIEQGLQRGIPYKGIGEFHIYGNDAKVPTVKRIVDLAVERNLVLHAHSDTEAIENLFALNPRAKILWAHTGMSTPIATVEKLLARYPNLWSELALRYDVASGGELDPGWRALFIKYPDRFMYGTDTWVESRWEQVTPLALDARGWLSELPRDVAEKIAWRNFETLFGK